MGLFDLASPAFTWVDSEILGFLPGVARLVLWGLLAGLASMLLYKWLSPQRALRQCKSEAAEARAALNRYEGDMAGMWPVAGRLLRLSLRQVKLTAMPAVAASIPILFLLVWVSTAFGYRFPEPGEAVEVRASSEALEGQSIAAAVRHVPTGDPAPHVVVSNGDGDTVTDVPLAKPVPVIHKREWWNALIGNPAGYLPDGAAVDRIEIALPRLEFVGLGPDWMRGWEAVFFAALLAGSLGFKVVGRVH